ncbi:hypothetical protein K0M31_007491, partial [Melipona bicolor]
CQFSVYYLSNIKFTRTTRTKATGEYPDVYVCAVSKMFALYTRKKLRNAGLEKYRAAFFFDKTVFSLEEEPGTALFPKEDRGKGIGSGLYLVIVT